MRIVVLTIAVHADMPHSGPEVAEQEQSVRRWNSVPLSEASQACQVPSPCGHHSAPKYHHIPLPRM